MPLRRSSKTSYNTRGGSSRSTVDSCPQETVPQCNQHDKSRFYETGKAWVVVKTRSVTVIHHVDYSIEQFILDGNLLYLEALAERAGVDIEDLRVFRQRAHAIKSKLAPPSQV